MAGQLHGRDGDITLNGVSNTLKLDSWTLNRSRDLHETTVYGSTWRTRKPGLRDWNAQCSGIYNYGDANQESVRDKLEDGTTATLTVEFRVDGSSSMYSGAAHIASDVITTNLGDMIRWQCNVTGSGALTYTS